MMLILLPMIYVILQNQFWVTHPTQILNGVIILNIITVLKAVNLWKYIITDIMNTPLMIQHQKK